MTIEDSDNLHTICETSEPPVRYLNDTSRAIQNLVRSFNSEEIRAAYTFDAGPNAFLITLSKNAKDLLKEILNNFNVNGYQ